MSFRPGGARVLINSVNGLYKATMALSSRISGSIRTWIIFGGLRAFLNFSDRLLTRLACQSSQSVFQSVRLVSPLSPSFLDPSNHSPSCLNPSSLSPSSQPSQPFLPQSIDLSSFQSTPLSSVSPSSPRLLFASLPFSPAPLGPLDSVRRAAVELGDKVNQPNIGNG